MKFDMFFFMFKNGLREGFIEVIIIFVYFYRINVYWVIFWIKCFGNFVKL